MTKIERQNRGRHLNTSVWSGWLASLVLAFGFMAFAVPAASAETRSLKLYFVHTREKAEIVFKRNGRYDQAGLQKINRFLRDWRRNEPTKMDPRLIDLVWEAYRASGSRDYIHVISAYRSPATNSMLRSRSSGVANKSQHMLGKAMDFYLPDVKLKTLRDIGLKMQVGGVGYYPRSGSPFVHMDVGNVRHWPRMSRKELVAVFPSGKTLHVPSDGKPLPGYEQAVASYQARKKSGASVAVASASGSRSGGGLLSAFFGGGADEEEDSSTAVAAAAPQPKAAVKAAPQPKAVVKAEPEKPQPNIQIVPPELARPAEIRPAQTEEPREETPEAIIAALPRRDIPLPGVAPRPQVDVGAAAAAPAPADIPFQVVPDDAAADAPQSPPAEVALNVPLPTRRPSYSPPVELASAEEKPADDAVSALLAMAAEPVAASVPMPSLRPGEEQAEDDGVAEDESVAEDARAAHDQFLVAALPQPRPTLAPPSGMTPVAVAPASAASISDAPVEDNPFGAAAADPIAVPAMMEPELKGGRVAAIASTATPRALVSSRAPGSDPASAIASGVKTTAKSAKPGVRDGKPEPKPVVVTAQPQAARWALHNDYVTRTTKGTKAPSFAYNLVRTAPLEVYTAGFQQGEQERDANRFSGKAVTFLSVARFTTN